ncbi:pseudopilin GspJ [bacterium BMS3Abin14]|nr:pseudopilin GspJ [bacterium BMS3Abin14]
MNHLSRGPEKGFTLIEVMVAFTILAVMAGVAFSVVFSSTKRSRALDRQMNLSMEAGSIMNLITEDLAGTFRREGTIPFFVGSDVFHEDIPSDEVQFLTTSTLPVDPQASRGDLAEVAYRLTFDEEGRSTLFRREQSPPSGAYDEGGVSNVVSDKVRSFNLRYYDGRDWVDEWDSLDTGGGSDHGKIPLEIEIEIKLSDGDFSTTLRTRIAPPMAAAQ